MTDSARSLRRRIRWVLGFFIAALAISGLTAFPLQLELDAMVAARGAHIFGAAHGSFDWWILTVRNGLGVVYRDYPWMGYGTDWLAFGHLVIALFFVGAWRDPVRNIWLLTAGLIACVGVIPVAMLCGVLRGIPIYWRLIDCAFGVLGFLPLWLARRWTLVLEKDEG